MGLFKAAYVVSRYGLSVVARMAAHVAVTCRPLRLGSYVGVGSVKVGSVAVRYGTASIIY